MTDNERDYKDWLQSREIDTALATIEAAQDEYDAMVHRLNDALADRDRLAARVRELEAALAQNARLRAANKRLAELLGHVLKNGRLEDDEMADARAALADSSGPAEQEER